MLAAARLLVYNQEMLVGFAGSQTLVGHMVYQKQAMTKAMHRSCHMVCRQLDVAC